MLQSTSQIQQRIDRVLSCRLRLADYREAWPRVLPGLEELAAMRLADDWSIESLRGMFDEDLAMLLTDEEDASAFVVVWFDAAKYDKNERELYVYLVWHNGGDAIDRFQPHLEAFAEHYGAKYMRFYSPRRAFLRVAARHGYKACAIEYVKELHA